MSNKLKGKLAISLIVNYYRAYILATSPKLWAGDEYWTSAAPRSNILSPAHNFGLVTNICPVIINNKLYIANLLRDDMEIFGRKLRTIWKYSAASCGRIFSYSATSLKSL